MPQNQCEISPLASTDYTEVDALWRSTEGLGGSETQPALTRFLERNPGFSQAARFAGRLIGAVMCGHDGRRGYLYHLAVAREFRGQGVGRKLVDECLARLHHAGIARCTIFLIGDNGGGEAFWTKAGWTLRTDLKTMAKNTSGEPFELRIKPSK